MARDWFDLFGRVGATSFIFFLMMAVAYGGSDKKGGKADVFAWLAAWFFVVAILCLIGAIWTVDR